MELLFATGNRHKQEELAQILTEHTIITPADLNIEFNYDETGSTYFDNAYGKALHLYKITGKPVIADDSGLSVDALNGAPGIKSARYGEDIKGKLLSDSEKMEYLLKNMQGIDKRSAHFVCCMVMLHSPMRFSSVQETLEGEIALAPSGKAGFGYDPIFYIPNLNATASEIGSAKKNEISHRGKAALKMRNLLINSK